MDGRNQGCDGGTNIIDLYTSPGCCVFLCYETHENNVVVLVFMSILLKEWGMDENVSYLCRGRNLECVLVFIMCKMRKHRKHAMLLGVTLQSQGLESMKINPAALML